MKEQAPDNDGWQRQHPRMLLILPVQQILRYLPAVIGLVIFGAARDGGPPWWAGLLAAAGVVGLGVLTWFTTRYRITGEQLQLRKGLFNTNTVTTPVDRVRTVDVTASALHRVLGLAEVKIGTGADESKLELDGLTATRAAALRAELIHQRHAGQVLHDGEGSEGSEGSEGIEGIEGSESIQPQGAIDDETDIARFNPAWIKFALFSATGIASAAAIFGIGWQIIDRSGVDLTDSGVAQRGEDTVRDLGVVAVVVIGVAIALMVILLLSLAGYILSYWGYRLTRNERGGTLQVSRGLLTTRTVTIEERRLRGVKMTETLPMRPARGASLEVITTGLGSESGESGLLVPPAPVAIVREVADEVLAVPHTLDTALQSHGPAAARRRWSRAFVAGLIPAAIIVGGTFAFGWAPELGLIALIPILPAPWLAKDRARSLGHALTPRYLVARDGSVMRDTVAVERSGVIGVTMSESFFQRRAGLMTVTMTTAAGSESYDVQDVPSSDGVALATELLPGHMSPLLK
ncbi:PH domain-containing protein [Demetria terragena]|uniref:PH domain-containing protein n=1 Tax=Demetria terragena TaxID=63959 RepID=UPI00037336AD|nr:PH domain-containing protein [Demetria terragena]